MWMGRYVFWVVVTFLAFLDPASAFELLQTKPIFQDMPGEAYELGLSNIEKVTESRFGVRTVLRKNGPDRAIVKRIAAEYRKSERVVIDIEAWPLVPASMATGNTEKHLEWLEKTLSWWKEENKDSKICVFGLPNNDAAWWAIFKSTRGDEGRVAEYWDFERHVAKRIFGLVDFLCPSGYWKRDTPEVNASAWRLMARVAHEIYRKPIIFFTWHRNPKGFSWLDPRTYRFSLEQFCLVADGIIVWGHGDEKARDVFDPKPKVRTLLGDRYRAPNGNLSTNRMMRDWEAHTRFDAAAGEYVSDKQLPKEAAWISELMAFLRTAHMRCPAN